MALGHKSSRKQYATTTEPTIKNGNTTSYTTNTFHTNKQPPTTSDFHNSCYKVQIHKTIALNQQTQSSQSPKST